MLVARRAAAQDRDQDHPAHGGHASTRRTPRAGSRYSPRVAYAVITREADAAAPYAAALAALGLEAVALPVTSTAPAGDPDELARALARGGHAAIVVASARGAAALDAARRGARCPRRARSGRSGRRRSARSRRRGSRRRCRRRRATRRASPGRCSPSARSRGRRVLVPRAEEGRTEPIELLRAAGAEVDGRHRVSHGAGARRRPGARARARSCSRRRGRRCAACSHRRRSPRSAR